MIRHGGPARWALPILLTWGMAAGASMAEHGERARAAGIDVITYPTGVKDVVDLTQRHEAECTQQEPGADYHLPRRLHITAVMERRITQYPARRNAEDAPGQANEFREIRKIEIEMPRREEFRDEPPTAQPEAISLHIRKQHQCATAQDNAQRPQGSCRQV